MRESLSEYIAVRSKGYYLKFFYVFCDTCKNRRLRVLFHLRIVQNKSDRVRGVRYILTTHTHYCFLTTFGIESIPWSPKSVIIPSIDQFALKFCKIFVVLCCFSLASFYQRKLIYQLCRQFYRPPQVFLERKLRGRKLETSEINEMLKVST